MTQFLFSPRVVFEYVHHWGLDVNQVNNKSFRQQSLLVDEQKWQTEVTWRFLNYLWNPAAV